MPNEPEKEKKATIFGAGITGLTAAHELVIRGFDVTVYEPNLNHNLGQRTLDRGVGGMARSQFAVDSEDDNNELEELKPASELLRDATLEFKINAKGEAVLVEARPTDVEAKFIKLVEKLAAKKDLPSLQIFLPVVDRANARERKKDPRFLWLASKVSHVVTADILFEKCVSSPVMTTPHENMVFFGTFYNVLAGEHGFRFFPSFYRHLYDTMKRTPILNPRPSEIQGRSTFDNLVAVENLGFARAGEVTSFLLPRRPTASFEELRSNLGKMLEQLEYTTEDLARFTLKLFEYMTSCTKRREAEYENMSWADFVGLESYSRVMRDHLEAGPQMMASLRGSKSDARTQGTIVVQLLLDQLLAGPNVDSTLARPTNGLWFDHWHDYLVTQGVKFVRGSLTELRDVEGKLAPIVETSSGTAPIRDGYVVIAIPLEEAAKLGSRSRAARVAANNGVNAGPALNDLERAAKFLGMTSRDAFAANAFASSSDYPLRHMSGIQFFFETEVKFWKGHTQYLDSEWGLTSISQPQFWYKKRDLSDAYRSILSVDIGIWDRPTVAGQRPRRKGRPDRTITKSNDPLMAEKCMPRILAQEVWSQIEDHHDEAYADTYGVNARVPVPRYFSLDQSLEFENGKGLVGNRYLYLVNVAGQYRLRPGKVAEKSPKASALYEVFEERFVLAGTHMQTYTRITSMEAANESARHAVNAILEDARAQCDRCDIWDPEDHELPDLQWFKELDETLFDKELPHFSRILGWEELPRISMADVSRVLDKKGILK